MTGHGFTRPERKTLKSVQYEYRPHPALISSALLMAWLLKGHKNNLIKSARLLAQYDLYFLNKIKGLSLPGQCLVNALVT